MIRKLLVATILPLLCVSAMAQQSLNVELLDHWNDTLVPNNGFGATFNEVWGFVQNDEEYAVIGSSVGTHFFRITTNDEFEEITMIPGAFQGPVVHRDYHDHNGYLYAICQQGSSTLQIMDLQYLPDSVSVVYDSDTLFNVAHNVFVDTAMAKLYVCGPPGAAMTVYSIDDPIDPVFLGFFFETDYVHDCFVRNDTAYLNCGGQGLFVYDFSQSILFPDLLGSLTSYTDQGYNHAGWLSVDGNKYVFSDETQAMRMKVCDVSDLTDIQVQGLFNSEQDSGTVPHNVMIKEDIVYVSHYNDGLQIFNVSDPTNPVKVGYYDTWLGPDDSHFKGAWGIYAFLPSGRLLISDRQSGLYLFNFTQPVGIADHGTEIEFSLYPNPNNGSFYLEGEALKNDLQLALFDISGKEVWSGKNNGSERINIQTEDLNSGIYLMRLVSKSAVETMRVLIDR